MSLPPSSTLEIADARFWVKVDKTDGCWEWTGARNSNGYGNFRAFGRFWVAHRYAYTRSVGEVCENLDLDHLCRNRLCVNPSHMEPVTRQVNLNRGISANREKTTCKRGHIYTADSTGFHGDSRFCRICTREQARERYRQFESAKRKVARVIAQQKQEI